MNHLIDMDERWKAIFSAIGVIIINVLALFGINVDDGATVQNVMLGLAWIASILWAIWKNHSFTDAAIQGDRVMHAIKDVKKETGNTISAEMALELTDGVDHDGE